MEIARVKVEIFFIAYKDSSERVILVDGEEIYHDNQKCWLRVREKSVFRDFENWLDEQYLPKEFDNRCCTTDQTRERRSFLQILCSKFFRRASSSSPNLLRLAFRVSS